MKTFSELGIYDYFVKALNENNIINPTEIQFKAIPFLLNEGKDFIGQAQTGTGKTAAYGLPILQKIDVKNTQPQALILSPTRELGQQIAKHLFKFTKFVPSKIFVESLCGGAKIDLQIASLRRPTHVIVATPGRLVDLLERKAISLTNIKTIVLDEADEMLSMGFKKDLDTILSATRGQRYTWLFSATMPKELKEIITGYMSPNAMKIQINKDDVINRNIEHKFVMCRREEKNEFLIHFLRSQLEERGVIFCRTKAGAQAVAELLEKQEFNVAALQGDMIQKERDKVMRAFKSKKLQLLVATDLAARGIDVADLSWVIHYDLPEKTEYFTHRSGRTARAGKKGFSLCMITTGDKDALRAIERELQITFREYNPYK
ncbi:MAG TPA: DEAD/DEAH box helicase [Bacteroidales bacterium]|nr:DEAD/DEAH box helicase [Bacteroidales bacterium]